MTDFIVNCDDGYIDLVNRTTREHFEEHGEGHWSKDHHQGQRQRQRGQGDFNHKTDDGKFYYMTKSVGRFHGRNMATQ